MMMFSFKRQIIFLWLAENDSDFERVRTTW